MKVSFKQLEFWAATIIYAFAIVLVLIGASHGPLYTPYVPVGMHVSEINMQKFFDTKFSGLRYFIIPYLSRYSAIYVSYLLLNFRIVPNLFEKKSVLLNSVFILLTFLFAYVVVGVSDIYLRVYLFFSISWEKEMVYRQIFYDAFLYTVLLAFLYSIYIFIKYYFTQFFKRLEDILSIASVVRDCIIAFSLWTFIFFSLNDGGLQDDERMIWLFIIFPAILLYGYSLGTLLLSHPKSFSSHQKAFFESLLIAMIPGVVIFTFFAPTLHSLNFYYSNGILLMIMNTFFQLTITAPMSYIIYRRRMKKDINMKESKVAAGKSDAAIQDYFFLKSGYEQVKVLFEDIFYLEAAGNYVNFVMKDKSLLSRMTFAELDNLLPDNKFIRVHRSYVAAINKIDKIERHQVRVNGKNLPVGEMYIKNLVLLK